jgi:hypothetical protein
LLIKRVIEKKIVEEPIVWASAGEASLNGTLTKDAKPGMLENDIAPDCLRTGK